MTDKAKAAEPVAAAEPATPVDPVAEAQKKLDKAQEAYDKSLAHTCSAQDDVTAAKKELLALQ